MPKPQTRKLAAILFADIVGYTALMQSNEPEALAALHKFKTELETKVPNHKGEIIQFYGDGCLVVFNSSVDAVTCAKKLQLAFQSDQKVPVRIGLHAGDVVFKDDNVFGDAVNIASRVESMGISGAVLLSSNVRNQIKNQPEFDLVSLGRFEFKNVVEGMTVYALQGENLAVPKKGEIKGKLKEPLQAKPKKHWLWSVPLILAAILFGLYQWYQTNNANKFEAAILKERIAVLPFKNNTNNPELDILGDMAADWINQGLMDIGEAEVVSPFTVRTHRDAIGILENDPQGRPSFAELTGAQNLITGNFYQEKDELIFKLEIVDALEGNLRFGFKPIRGAETDKEALITKLRAQTMGYWVARELVDTKRIKAPKYEAYEQYLLSLQSSTIEDARIKIVALDSTFYFPRIFFTYNNRFGYYGGNIVHFEFLERHFSNLTAYEKGWFNAAKGLYLGNRLESFKHLNEMRLKYPKDPITNHETAALASSELNNPELALEIYDNLPIDKIEPKNLGDFYSFRIFNQVSSLLRLNRFKEAILLLETIKKPSPTLGYTYPAYLMALLNASIMSNQESSKIGAIFKELANPKNDNSIFYFYVVFSMLESNFLKEEYRVRLKKDMLSNFEKLAPNDMNRFLWNNLIAWLAQKPENINLDNLHQMPISFQMANLFYAGRTFIDEGKLEKIPFIMEELQKYTQLNYLITRSSGPAIAYYNMAHLYTKLGQYDKALENLKKSRALGQYNNLFQFEYDRHLAPLYDMPEFRELLKPIWPEVKD